MLNVNEQEGLLHYLEFLLMKQLIEPISSHISDPDVIGFMYDQTYAILNQLETEILDYNGNRTVELAKKD